MNSDKSLAPLPPHDRPWRHPSELAQHEHSRTFVNAPPISRILVFVASLTAVAMSLLVLGLSPPMSPLDESIAASSNLPAASVRSGARFDTQLVQTEAYLCIILQKTQAHQTTQCCSTSTSLFWGENASRQRLDLAQHK